MYEINTQRDQHSGETGGSSNMWGDGVLADHPVQWNVDVVPHVHAITSARVISTHSHSRRLIILLATRLSSSFVVFPRSAGSLTSNSGIVFIPIYSSPNFVEESTSL